MLQSKIGIFSLVMEIFLYTILTFLLTASVLDSFLQDSRSPVPVMFPYFHRQFMLDLRSIDPRNITDTNRNMHHF